MAIAVTLTSCLITQPVHFDEPANSPPSITAGAFYPLNDFIHYPGIVTCDASVCPPPDLTFSVTVFDADVDQTLHYAALVDSSLSPCSGCNGDLLPSSALTGRERRTLPFTVTSGAIAGTVPGCHRITLIVTGAFESGSSRPRDPVNDTATAVWWVWVRPNNNESVDITECPPPP